MSSVYVDNALIEESAFAPHLLRQRSGTLRVRHYIQVWIYSEGKIRTSKGKISDPMSPALQMICRVNMRSISFERDDIPILFHLGQHV